MLRTLEPELMDDAEQARAYAAADFDEVNQAFVDRFLTLPGASSVRRLIDLGCGPCDIPIRLCERLPQLSVTALDGSEAMLGLARQAIASRATQPTGLERRIELRCARLPLPASQADQFDAVISNSLLHHLPEPEVLWQSLRQLAAPGALLLVVDLIRPPSRQAADALVERYARDEHPVLKRDFLNSLLAAFTLQEVKQQLASVGLTLEVDVVSDRHLVAHGAA